MQNISFDGSAIQLDCLCVHFDGSVSEVELANQLKASHTDRRYKTLHVVEGNMRSASNFIDDII